MLGGMMGPKAPPAAIVAQENARSYPAFVISLMAIMPMPAAQAAADPDIAAMMTQATIAAFDNPPQRCPRHTRPNPKRLRLMPPTLIKFPIKRKNGIDISVMPETWANIRCGTKKRRAASPPAKRNVATEAKPIVTAVVTPKSISTRTAAKMANITMSGNPYRGKNENRRQCTRPTQEKSPAARVREAF